MKVQRGEMYSSAFPLTSPLVNVTPPPLKRQKRDSAPIVQETVWVTERV